VTGPTRSISIPPFNPGTLLRAFLLAVMTLVAYLPALSGGYVWDDPHHVAVAATLHTGEGLARIWLTPMATPQYYPLTYSAFWLQYHLWGFHPFGYHAVNLVLHILNALLVWALLRRLALPGAWWAAALFALHPVQVESVAWVSELKNVLSGACYWGAALAYLRFAGIGAHRATGGRTWYGLSLALFLLALLAKTVTCTLPAALLLILWWQRGRLGRRELLPLVPFLGAAVVLGLVAVWFERDAVGAQGPAWAFSAADRVLIAGRALWFYVGKLLWPADLAFIYPRWEIDPADWRQWLWPLGALAVIGGLWRMRHRWGRGPLTAVLCFAATLSPALGFINFYPMRYAFVADHFQYLACAAPIGSAAAVVAAWMGRRSSALRALGASCTVFLLVGLGALSRGQGAMYRDRETLWRATLAKNPSAWMAHVNLGRVLIAQRRVADGIRHYRRALALNPQAMEDHRQVGERLLGRGPQTGASAEVREGVRLLEEGKLEEAVAVFTRALERNPDDTAAHYHLTRALSRQETL
jgi:hypothetical protein